MRNPETIAGVREPKWEAVQGHAEGPAERLAYDLAVELEQADLDRNDLVTVNRAKLISISERALERASLAESAPNPSDAFMAWVHQGPALAKAAGLYVGIKIYASEQAARAAGDIS